MKKVKYLLVSLLIILAIFVMAGCGKKEEVQEGETPNENVQNVEESNEKTETKTYNDKALNGLEGATLDYYWNIDTAAFDSTKFNGNINFF